MLQPSKQNIIETIDIEMAVEVKIDPGKVMSKVI